MGGKQEAIQKLAQSKGCGQLIFRPSSRGLSYLSMTWKMADNPDIFVHYLIQEKLKPNPYAVGKQLIVGNTKYDDLDEIYTHHKPRLNELSQIMIQHKNFLYGTELDITEMLQDEINVNEKKTCYALSYSYKRPGHFLLSYIINTSNSRKKTQKKHKVQKEYIGLTYLGYKFRNCYFDDPGKLINWFKQNFKKNHPKYGHQHISQTKKKKPDNYSYPPPPPQPHQTLNDDVTFNHYQNNNHRGGGGYYQPPQPQQYQPHH